MESAPAKRLLTKDERQKYEDTYTYMYVTTDSSSVFRPITVLRARGAPNQYLVPGRYSGFSEEGQLYTPLTEEEQRQVMQQLGANKIVKFL